MEVGEEEEMEGAMLQMEATEMLQMNRSPELETCFSLFCIPGFEFIRSK